MTYRILYKRAFSTQAEAIKAQKEAAESASNPKVVQGKSGAWLCVLYEHTSRERITQGYRHYRSLGLTVYLQEVQD